MAQWSGRKPRTPSASIPRHCFSTSLNSSSFIHLKSRAVVDSTSIPTKPDLQHQIENSQKSLPALYPSVESKSVAISVALYLALHSLGNLFGPCSDLHT